MRVLHTADWHLGRTLYNKRRYEEFRHFLAWLLDTLKEEHIDILLVAGDIFDTTTPSSTYQQLYYQFLYDASKICQHIVITSGNHDSASLLDMTKPVLRHLNIHVIGMMTQDPKDEVIVLQKESVIQAIICAVPYLRDRDLRTAELGETVADRDAKLSQGIKDHYEQATAHAYQLQQDYAQHQDVHIPIIVMGHLFATGGTAIPMGDGVRDLYVGSLGRVGTDIFPAFCDYVALGHLHVAHCVNKDPRIRYSGSPIPMGYGEANQKKQVVLLDFDGKSMQIHEKEIPCFQELIHISATLAEIQEKIAQLKKENSQAWLDIEYTDLATISNIREILNKDLEGSHLEILKMTKKNKEQGDFATLEDQEHLRDLSPEDVFARCLDLYQVPQEEREDLFFLYREILHDLSQRDPHAQENSSK